MKFYSRWSALTSASILTSAVGTTSAKKSYQIMMKSTKKELKISKNSGNILGHFESNRLCFLWIMFCLIHVPFFSRTIFNLKMSEANQFLDKSWCTLFWYSNLLKHKATSFAASLHFFFLNINKWQTLDRVTKEYWWQQLNLFSRLIYLPCLVPPCYFNISNFIKWMSSLEKNKILLVTIHLSKIK